MCIYIVDQQHPHAADSNQGSQDRPFLTINRAAGLAEAGDTVRVRRGVYRERINPRRGGEPGRPVTYEAAEGEDVFLRGSEIFAPKWEAVAELPGVWAGSLDGVAFGIAAYAGHLDAELYADFNPFRTNFNKNKAARPHAAIIEQLRQAIEAARTRLEEIAPEEELAFNGASQRKADLEMELDQRTRKENRRHLTTLGQVFFDGAPLTEVETFEDLHSMPGAWMVGPEGDALLVHPPEAGRTLAEAQVEISVRHTVFSPLCRRLGHIVVRGFVIEHAANHFPTWGPVGWAQCGMPSCRSGHHWVIERNVIRFAKGVGLDCGSEGGREKMENRGEPPPAGGGHAETDWSRAGHDLIRGNVISDNGHCGLAGLGHVGTRVIGNTFERNNRDGWTSPWWEFGAIKFHFFFDGLIEGNLIRDNEAHGIWIDNQWRGSRITRNVIVNNLWSGINVELGRGPVLIDHNVIALTRNGDGIYGHDVADVTMAHNLIYGNANFGVWFAFATPRVKPENGCWDIRVLNNILAGNRGGAVALPLPWQCAGGNVSDGNRSSALEYLDEGSGSRPPLFQFTNDTHMANMPRFYPEGFESQSAARVREKFVQALGEAGLEECRWPNVEVWAPFYLVNIEQWRAAFNGDRNSRVMEKVIRDGLSSHGRFFEMRFDETIREVECVPVAGIDDDFHGRPVPQSRPVPGPFQNVRTGEKNRWPLSPNPNSAATGEFVGLTPLS